MLGLARKDVFGRSLAECRVECNSADISTAISECRISQRTTSLHDVRYERPHGRPRFLGVTAGPLKTSSSETGGILLVMAERTERKHVDSQLVQARKLKSVGQLAAGIAHEINTPIQYLGDNVRLLSDSSNDLLGLISSYCDLISLSTKSASAEGCVWAKPRRWSRRRICHISKRSCPSRSRKASTVLTG